jgi:hypothetical protein
VAKAFRMSILMHIDPSRSIPKKVGLKGSHYARYGLYLFSIQLTFTV